ncbi:peroxiredoxin [Parabacteroides sp. PFB2-12]|uniref:TlpA family protein disulfide reductase n=1 Tax=unclassified Parabacteroides TaxID=2649774 RepID=UPI002475CD26|nr:MULTISPECIES: TlpA disulfide reductase family protein [unclassified Parabacteroides]MDH6342688.1 peroxiredoxin [Parabacteroides sp. PM6-13]MDH6389751.1 peroxiredoxin [Parabacteroides sp. PFB2-12]
MRIFSHAGENKKNGRETGIKIPRFGQQVKSLDLYLWRSITDEIIIRKHSMKYLIVAIVALTICPTLFAQRFDLNQKDSTNMLLAAYFAERNDLHQARKTEPFPDFTAVSLDGDTITRDMLDDKVVLMNFWFESCRPCMAELDDLSKLYLTFKENPSFLFLSFTVDPKERAVKCVEKHNIPFPVCPIEREESSRLTIKSGFPMTIILDRSGKTVFSRGGGAIEKEHVVKQVKEYEVIIKNLLNKAPY